MVLQAAIGGKTEMTPEKKINLMLQQGINVFILRWKKVHAFRTSYFNLEVLRFIKRISGPTRETKIVPKVERGELKFDPDENDVPVAYLPDTPYNRQALAMSFYSSQYVISGLITPTATVSAGEIQKEIEALSVKAGVPKPVPRKIVGVYGDSIRVKPKVGQATKSAPKTITAAQSVYGNEEKKNEEMAKATTLTVDECFKNGEEKAHAKYATLIQKLQKEGPKIWKSSKYYKDVVEVEVLEETKKLLEANGHPADSKPTPPPPPAQQPAPPAPAPEKDAAAPAPA